MQHARTLIESRPVLDRVPDQSLIASDPGTGADHIRATRATDYSYAFVYLPSGGTVTLDLASFSSPLLFTWFDPRTGTSHPMPKSPSGSNATVTAPTTGPTNDWILTLQPGP